MSEQVITAEAVEAAWNALDDMGQYVNKEDLRAALEAAAPHMLAGVWDEAYKQAVHDLVTIQENPTPNPYGSQP